MCRCPRSPPLSQLKGASPASETTGGVGAAGEDEVTVATPDRLTEHTKSPKIPLIYEREGGTATMPAQFVALPVGQGDAFLLEREGLHLLVDGGKSRRQCVDHLRQHLPVSWSMPTLTQPSLRATS